MAKLIFGCGYLGERVARRWRDAGERVFVVTRSDNRARDLAEQGFSPIIADVVRPASLVNLPTPQTVLYAIGYDRGAGASLHAVFAEGLRSVLAALPTETGKFIYTSTTGVYGQSQGESVDEDSPCEPQREQARACLEAERVLAAHPLGRRAVTLRMAGLYGPERIPNADPIRRGQPISAPQQGLLNLIHIDDAVEVIVAADERACVPRTYIVSDGTPVERRAYYQELARLLGAPPPDFVPSPADSPAAARATSDKRASNRRMLAELGVSLRYPSYREGLAAIVASGPTELRSPPAG